MHITHNRDKIFVNYYIRSKKELEMGFLTSRFVRKVEVSWSATQFLKITLSDLTLLRKWVIFFILCHSQNTSTLST